MATPHRQRFSNASDYRLPLHRGVRHRYRPTIRFYGYYIVAHSLNFAINAESSDLRPQFRHWPPVDTLKALLSFTIIAVIIIDTFSGSTRLPLHSNTDKSQMIAIGLSFS